MTKGLPKEGSLVGVVELEDDDAESVLGAVMDFATISFIAFTSAGESVLESSFSNSTSVFT